MASAVFLGLNLAELMSVGGSESHCIGVGCRENNIFGLEGSQAVPASPSGRNKTYGQNLYKIYFLWGRGAAFERNLIRH
jgi:hypothetical protein